MATFAVSKGITRFEDQSSHSNGFMVRIHRNGKQINEFFSDGKLGGKKKAKAAAMARYDALVKELGPPKDRPTRGLLTDRNTTGVVGVHVAHTVDTRWTGNDYYSYCASWINAAGKREKINFSWRVYGKESAFELACLARSRMISNREKVLSLFEKAGGKLHASSGSGNSSSTKKGSAATKKTTATKSTAKTTTKSVTKAASNKKVVKKSVTKKAPVVSKKKAAKKGARPKSATRTVKKGVKAKR